MMDYKKHVKNFHRFPNLGFNGRKSSVKCIREIYFFNIEASVSGSLGLAYTNINK